MTDDKKASIRKILHSHCERYQATAGHDQSDFSYEDRVEHASNDLAHLFGEFPEVRKHDRQVITKELTTLIKLLKSVYGLKLSEQTRKMIIAKFGLTASIRGDPITSDHISKTLTTLGVNSANDDRSSLLLGPLQELVDFLDTIEGFKRHSRNLKAEYAAHKCRSHWKFLTATDAPNTVTDDLQALLPFTDEIFNVIFENPVPNAKHHLNKAYTDETYRMLKMGWG